MVITKKERGKTGEREGKRRERKGKGDTGEREERQEEKGGGNRAKNEINKKDKEEAAQLKVSLGRANCCAHHFHRL